MNVVLLQASSNSIKTHEPVI